MMKRIAVLNDLSGLGKCSLTAAIPVISVMGVQACPLPTAILSNQTGYASCYWDDYTDHMEAYMAEWKKRNFIPDGIYTGFAAGEKQAEKLLAFLAEFSGKNTRILTDPVLGDQGCAYPFYTEGLCGRMRALVHEAHVITPNLTEALLLLGGREGMEQNWQALKAAGPKEYQERIAHIGEMLAEQFELEAAVITGIDLPEKDGIPQIGNLVHENGRSVWITSEKAGGSYSGTGDLFASVLCAGMVKGLSMENCAKKAASFLTKSIRDTVREGTDRNDGVCFETYLYELADPGDLRKAGGFLC